MYRKLNDRRSCRGKQERIERTNWKQSREKEVRSRGGDSRREGECVESWDYGEARSEGTTGMGEKHYSNRQLCAMAKYEDMGI